MGDLVGYARVSTPEQSIEAQVQQLQKAGCTRIFVEHRSGKSKIKRTELDKLLEYLRPEDVVLVTGLDRLSRSLMDLLSISEDIHAKGAQLKSLSENIDTTSYAGQMIFYVMGILAEFERKRIRERTLAGLAHARAQGRIGGRPRKLNDTQLALVRQFRQEGQSLREIARTFNVSVGTIHRVVKQPDS